MNVCFFISSLALMQSFSEKIRSGAEHRLKHNTYRSRLEHQYSLTCKRKILYVAVEDMCIKLKYERNLIFWSSC